jgi:hypothetical protein
MARPPNKMPKIPATIFFSAPGGLSLIVFKFSFGVVSTDFSAISQPVCFALFVSRPSI